MNKKLILLIVVPIVVVGLVAAGLLTYYGQIKQNVDVEQAVILSGGPSVGGSFVAGDTFSECGFDVKNNAVVEAPVEFQITQCIVGGGNCATPGYDEDGVTTEIIGTLELTKKTVDFGSDDWAVLDDKVQIKYTVVGSEFNAEVTKDVQNEDGYVLVYYADNDDRFANPGQAVLVEVVSGNLPAGGDYNIVNDYSAEYPTTPFGAKIWYVPFDALTPDNGAYDIDWSRALNNEFYFESSLIQYNAEGQITVYPTEVLDFCVENDFALNLEAGNYLVTTDVLPYTA